MPDEYIDSAAKLIVQLKRQTRSSMRWTKPENLHLTLRFLGNVDQGKLDGIYTALTPLTSAPFTLQADGFGAFPNTARPHSIWLALAEGGDHSVSLAERIAEALLPLGFDRPRPIRPHLTLGRVKQSNDDWPSVLSNTPAAFPSITVTRFTLWQSDLTPDGPIYTPLKEFPLT